MNQPAWVEVKGPRLCGWNLLVWEELGVQQGPPPDGAGAEEGQERRGRRTHAVGRGVLAGEGRHAVTSEGRVRRTDGAFIFLLKSFKPS